LIHAIVFKWLQMNAIFVAFKTIIRFSNIKSRVLGSNMDHVIFLFLLCFKLTD